MSMIDIPHDKQFSIQAPWPQKEPSRIMIDCYGSGDYVIGVRGKDTRFEWSDQFGPMPINKDGSECLSIGPKHGFWRAASLWNLQGRRMDGNRAIWHEPRQPVFEKKHVGGNNYVVTKVVDAGEPGWDW